MKSRRNFLKKLSSHYITFSCTEDDAEPESGSTSHNGFRPPEYVPIAGPLSLLFADVTPNVIEGRTLHLDATVPNIALSVDILRTASISSWDARALVTIENLTSFSEFLLIRPMHIMAIFTSGFASPALISFLHRLRIDYPHVPFFHWGDLDVGGLGILAHLRHHIENILPLCMDVTTFTRHQKDTQPLTDSDRIGMEDLLNNDMLKDCFSLIQYLLETNKKLEQESIRTSHALFALEKHIGKWGKGQTMSRENIVSSDIDLVFIPPPPE